MLRVPAIAETLATARALNETHTGQQVSSDWGQGAGEKCDTSVALEIGI